VALLGRCRIDYKRENEFRLCDEGKDEGSLTMFSLLFARTHCQSRAGAARYAMISDSDIAGWRWADQIRLNSLDWPGHM